jgi:hypothetical protein
MTASQTKPITKEGEGIGISTRYGWAVGIGVGIPVELQNWWVESHCMVDESQAAWAAHARCPIASV